MAAGAAAGAAAAIARAIKASGILVQLDPGEFQRILGRAEDPLVVVAQGGVFRTNYQYLMSYKGLAFYCRSSEPIPLDGRAEVVASQRIWIPG